MVLVKRLVLVMERGLARVMENGSVEVWDLPAAG